MMRSTAVKIVEFYRSMVVQLRRPSYTGKVFCIGYNKTGTTTIGKSFEMLGFRNSSFNKKVWREYYKKNQIDKIIAYTAKFDSFDDLPWLKEDMIPILDKTFPNSKFVYLERDEASWKKSFYNWAFKTFGTCPDVEEAWGSYKAHEKFVRDYFEGRSSDEFIILNVSDELGFKKLAAFLGVEAPFEKFPHYNKT